MHTSVKNGGRRSRRLAPAMMGEVVHLSIKNGLRLIWISLGIDWAGSIVRGLDLVAAHEFGSGDVNSRGRFDRYSIHNQLSLPLRYY